MESFIGSIFAFGGNFAPKGTLPCDGSILAIAQNTALFSILGTTYGGNGTTTFALPDLRGVAPIGWGNGPGLSPVALGQTGGTEATSLTRSNLPAVPATLSAAGDATSETASGNIFGTADGNMYNAGPPDTVMSAPVRNGLSGQGAPIGTVGPRLGVYFFIVAQGIYPSRG
ncbi:MAG TPA: tail fiber protein [Myxococcota bacterium]|nr:tail fiber protein [Myxococcota bacterium]HNH50748.1 tail fiber protein [Myxococcota bacterium]